MTTATTTTAMTHSLAAPAVTDNDPQETAEWRNAFAALVAAQGPERARTTKRGKGATIG